jgi:aspartate/methionine/tyrosine aminotransferase
MNVRVNSQLANLDESATLVINQRVKDLRAQGHSIVHFGFGQSPFQIHHSIQEALCKNADKKSYLPTKGLPELRETLARFIKKHFGYDYLPENILIGPGSKQLLYQATAVLEGPFILPAPSWVSYGPQAEILGKHILTIQTKKENSYKLTAHELDNICSSIDHRQKILMMNSPNNPTGTVYRKSELQDLASVCREHSVMVLSDEIYAHLSFDGVSPGGMAEFYPEGTLVSGGLSKAFHAGGYRLGFLAAPVGMEEAVRCMAVMSSETYTSVSAPIQYAAIEAFTNPAVTEYARACGQIHRATSHYLFERFKEMRLSCVEPEGAFYLFPDFEHYRSLLSKAAVRNSKQLSKKLLDTYGVATLPAGAFYCSNEMLACRVATVDYDGARVYEAFERARKLDKDFVLGKDFVEEHCPQLKLGVERIRQFLLDLEG